MQRFEYHAISQDGKKIRGELEALDEYEAAEKIKSDHLILLKLKPQKWKSQTNFWDFCKPKKINEKSLAMVCSQFSIILGAGLPIVRAVEMIANQSEDKTIKKVLLQVVQNISKGFSLAQSLEDQGQIFPPTFVETIRSGEQSGTLDKTFRRLHDHYHKSSKMKGKIRAALTYPIFTLVVAVLVIAIIMIVAVPTFVTSFQAMGIKMPLPTRILIETSNLFSHGWVFMVLVLLALWIGLQFYRSKEKGRRRLSEFQLKIPVFGRLTRMKAAAQFANTMATLLTAGMPIVNAVTTTGKVLDNFYLGERILHSVPQLETGLRLGDCLKQVSELPEMLVEMTAVGEETGTMENTLEVIGSYYDNETEMLSEKALSLLEPIIICILAGVVGLILLALYMPMLSIYGGIQ